MHISKGGGKNMLSVNGSEAAGLCIDEVVPNDLDRSTASEYTRMISGGMVELGVDDLKKRLDSIGYEIDEDISFDYVNRGNAIHYFARSVGIRHKASGLSFAHVDCDRTHLAELQYLRMHFFVFFKGRVWEL